MLEGDSRVDEIEHFAMKWQVGPIAADKCHVGDVGIELTSLDDHTSRDVDPYDRIEVLSQETRDSAEPASQIES